MEQEKVHNYKNTRQRSQKISSNSVQKAIQVNNQRVPFSMFEKSLMICIGIVTMVMMVYLVSLRTNTAENQHNLQNMSDRIQNVVSENNDTHQEINELSSPSRLLKIAKDQNLTLQANNVRNVSR